MNELQNCEFPYAKLFLFITITVIFVVARFEMHSLYLLQPMVVKFGFFRRTDVEEDNSDFLVIQISYIDLSP